MHLIPTNTNVMKRAKYYGEQWKSDPRDPNNSEGSGGDASIAIEYDDRIRTQHLREKNWYTTSKERYRVMP